MSLHWKVFSSFISNKDTDSNSYSRLLEDMSSQDIESLILIPSRREVLVKYKDGISKIIPILPNDQTVLQSAETNGIQLEVRDGRTEESYSTFTANFTLSFIFILLCTVLIRKSLKIANKSPTNNPKNKDADKSFNVITVALKSLGKLLIIKSKSINTPCYI